MEPRKSRILRHIVTQFSLRQFSDVFACCEISNFASRISNLESTAHLIYCPDDEALGLAWLSRTRAGAHLDSHVLIGPAAGAHRVFPDPDDPGVCPLSLDFFRLPAQNRRSVWLVLGFALLFRFTVLVAPPYQSEDVYRYLWDARVASLGSVRMHTRRRLQNWKNSGMTRFTQ